MKFIYCCFALGISLLPLNAASLTESTFTEVVNEVTTLSLAGGTAPSKLNTLLKSPERVRTGAQSRAELTAADNTITRVGANTVFSFADTGRTLNLEKGSLLFHSPHGNGGGIIKSGGAAAAVLGTTLMVSTTEDGGFKVILLEGRGQITLPDGKKLSLRAGQMIFILPGGGGTSRVLDINLDKLVRGSRLVNGFTAPLPSLPLILAEIKKQNGSLANGSMVDTGIPAGNRPSRHADLEALPYQVAIHQPLTKIQFKLIANLDPAPLPTDKNGIDPGLLGTAGGASLVPLGYVH